VGGVWNHTLELAQGLTARDIQVVLAVLGPRPSPEQLAAIDGTVDVIVTDLPLDWTGAAGSLRQAEGKALAQIAARAGVDLVHLNSPSLAAGGAFSLPLVIGCHSCVATWWQTLRGGNVLPPELARQRDLVGAGYAEADALVAPSRAFARMTAEHYRLRETLHVVHNGRGPVAAPEGQRSGIMAAGRLWDEAKDMALLNRIAPLLPVPIHVAGPLTAPHGGSAGFAYLHHLGVLGPDAMAAHLGNTQVLVAPSRYEPFGLAVLEAAQAGCALLLSDIPTFREIWGDAADYAPPGDDIAFVARLRRLLDDDAYGKRRSAAARKRSAIYSRDALADGMSNIYHLASRKRNTREVAA